MDNRNKTLAILVKPFAFLSMVGSALVVREVLSDPTKRGLTYHRQLLALSTADFLSSLWMFMSTWPIPEGTDGIWGASGTTGSCTAQGFFLQLSTPTSALYNSCLAIYYLLVIRYQWTEEKMRRRAAWLLLIVPIAFSLATSITGLALKLYNPTNLWCWIATYPAGCEGPDCRGRSDLANSVFRWAFAIGPVWAAFFVATVCMTSVYLFISRLPDEQVDGKVMGIFWFLIGEEGATVSKDARSRRLARQAFWYLLAFYTTWLFTTIVRIYQVTSTAPYALLVLLAIFLPSQGTFNFLIYVRPRFLRNREKHPEWSTLKQMIDKDVQDHELGAFKMRSTMRRNDLP